MSELLVEFWVPGKAAPKGSLNPGAGRDGRKLRESNDRTTPYRELVRDAAHKDMAARGVASTHRGAVRVTIVALFDPPRRPGSAAPVTTGVGDIDKISRAVLDALQDPRLTEGMKREIPESKLLGNDSQVVDLVAFERWGRLHNAGTIVRVEALPDDYLRRTGEGWIEYADRVADGQMARWVR
jgi:hypothetical protein